MSRTSEMRKVLGRWRRSGLSLRRFGVEEEISYSALQYWRRKLGALDERPGKRRQRRPEKRLELVPVEVRQGGTSEIARTEPTFEVRLSNGHGVRVGPGFDVDELRRLLEVVSAC